MDFSKGISNRYINKILYATCGQTYRGCWSSDTIPFTELKKLTNFSIVINLSKRREVGTHFITLLVSPKKVWLIDSLSLFDTPRRLKTQLRKHIYPGRQCVKLPTHEWQDVTSVFCGFFAIYCCLYFNKQNVIHPRGGINMRALSKPFSKHKLIENDKIVVKAVRKVYMNSTLIKSKNKH